MFRFDGKQQLIRGPTQLIACIKGYYRDLGVSDDTNVVRDACVLDQGRELVQRSLCHDRRRKSDDEVDISGSHSVAYCIWRKTLCSPSG